jgi:Skp family chaperone for outer membrane proteins
MKHLLALLLSAMTVVVCAQPHHGPPRLSPERMQEIRAQKSAYITARINLTPEEAQRFWPVYNKYDEESEALRRELRDMDRALREKGAAVTEAEAAALLEKEVANRQKEVDLLRKFHADSRKLIGTVRTMELGRAERDFHRDVLRRMRDERGQGQRTPPHPKR